MLLQCAYGVTFLTLSHFLIDRMFQFVAFNRAGFELLKGSNLLFSIYNFSALEEYKINIQKIKVSRIFFARLFKNLK